MFQRKSGEAAPKKPARNGAGGLSFIGPEVVVSGSIVTSAQLQVDGRIDGDVQCAVLIQGADGTICGNIRADEVRLAGLVEGTVTAPCVLVEGTARVTGDVTYRTIGIAAGARLDGRLTLSEDAAAAPDGRKPAAAARAGPRIAPSAEPLILSEPTPIAAE